MEWEVTKMAIVGFSHVKFPQKPSSLASVIVTIS